MLSAYGSVFRSCETSIRSACLVSGLYAGVSESRGFGAVSGAESRGGHGGNVIERVPSCPPFCFRGDLGLCFVGVEGRLIGVVFLRRDGQLDAGTPLSDPGLKISVPRPGRREPR